MVHPMLAFFSFVLTSFLLLLPCSSLSHDGAILLDIRNTDSRDNNNALSNNLLSGGVPAELGRMNLNIFNVSNNHLSGRIPDGLDNPAYKESFVGNPMLCGGRNVMLPSCSSSSKMSLQRHAVVEDDAIPFHRVDEAFILRNLRESNAIGSGGAGKVYKVILLNGQAMAVKKIQNRRNMSRSGRNRKRKSLHEVESRMGEVEVDKLGNIRHANILKLEILASELRFHSDFKLLVYEFMPNGSLFDCLHGNRSGAQVNLQWPIRYQIALGLARGLSYINHDCSPPLLHRDVKSNNVLLDQNFGAKISDFGVSKEINKLGYEFTVSGYVGSHGYIAPEYANRPKVNEKSDVYSFGVVLLELVSGKKATGEAEYGEDGDIVEWIRNRILMGGQEMAVFDDRMVGDNCIEQMMCVLHLGLVCTNRVPNQRPSMRIVVERLVTCGGDACKERFQNLRRSLSNDSDSDNNEAVFFQETDL